MIGHVVSVTYPACTTYHGATLVKHASAKSIPMYLHGYTKYPCEGRIGDCIVEDFQGHVHVVSPDIVSI